MMNTEKKLLRDDKIANEHNQITEGYMNEGYVKTVEKDPETESRNGIFRTLQSLNQIKKQRQESFFTLQQLRWYMRSYIKEQSCREI